MPGQPGQSTRPHARLPPRFLGMDACMTSQLDVALIRKLRDSMMCLAYCLQCYIHGCRCMGVDNRSSSTGIRCFTMY